MRTLHSLVGGKSKCRIWIGVLRSQSFSTLAQATTEHAWVISQIVKECENLEHTVPRCGLGK